AVPRHRSQHRRSVGTSAGRPLQTRSSAVALPHTPPGDRNRPLTGNAAANRRCVTKIGAMREASGDSPGRPWSSLTWASAQTLIGIGCLCNVWIILRIRESSDQSGGLAVVCTLLIAAVVLSISGALTAVFSIGVPRWQRWACALAGVLIPTVIVYG